MIVSSVRLLKSNADVDFHRNGHKNSASHIYCCWPRGAIKTLENTGIISDIVFEACSLLFGSFIHSGIVFRRGCGNHKING